MKPSWWTRCAAALFVATSLVWGPTAAGADAIRPTHEDVAYGPHERNVMDLWIADADEPTPLLIFMHGGGFRRGDKASIRNRAAVGQVLEEGVSFASINYRFLEHTGLPGILRDAARSIQFLRSEAAKWNLDPERIAIFGGSAGAGTSMWLAFHDDLADAAAADPVLRESSRVTAAGSLDGQVSYDQRDWEPYVGPPPAGVAMTDRLMFYGFADDAEADSPMGDKIMKDCSMIGLISADDPAVAIACGRPGGPSEDRGHYLHHPDHSIALAERCKAVGVDCLLVLRKDTEGDRARQAEMVVDYLVAKLKGAD